MKTMNYWILATLFALLLGCSRTPAETTGVAVDAAPQIALPVVYGPNFAGAAIHPDMPSVTRNASASHEMRTPAQLALDACNGRCRGTQVKPLLAAASTPVIPAPWTVPNWYIDPANALGCAADTNSGTAATCTGGCSGSVCTSGVGPLLTYQELAIHRWGTYSPRLAQNTFFSILSTDPSPETDPIYFKPYLETGAYAVWSCSLTQSWTGTGTLVAAKSRSGDQLLDMTLPAGAAIGQLVIDGTTGGHAFVYKASSTNWLMSQPILVPALGSLPLNPSSKAEDNSWATGNTVTGYTLATANFADIEPIILDADSTPNNNVFLYQCGGYGGPQAFSNMIVNGAVSMYDTSIARLVQVAPFLSPASEINNYGGGANVYLPEGMVISIASNSGGPFTLNGGVAKTLGTIGANYSIEGDFIFAASMQVSGLALLESAYFDTGASILVKFGDLELSNLNSNGVSVWGPAGIVNAQASSRVWYPSGAGAAVAAFLQTGALEVNGQTKTCIAAPGASAIGACNTTLNPSNLDSNGGSTANCLVALGGGSFCNYGN